MRKYAVLTAAASVVAVAFLSGCSKPAETSALSPDTKKAVDALTANEVDFAAAAKAKDVEKMVSHYTASGELLAPGQTPSKNTDVLRYVWRQMMADPAFALDFKASRIEVAASNDFAYSTGTYTLTSTDPKTKAPATHSGGYVTVYKKVANGSWKAMEDIVTTASAPAAPASPQVVTNPPPKAAPDTAADEAAIRAQETQWAADWKAKDATKLAAHYDAAATVLQPATPAMTGSAAIGAGLAEVAKDPAIKVEFSPDSVTVAPSGDIAFSRGKFTQTATDPKTRKPATIHGAYVTVYRKQADGNWKAVADAASEEP
ncbi:YybH family protein [Caulobacter sp. KR2-114]|uniref:YybH family protein n=1 Tax=Caulobacter sp. KR2-114 TaxID=3400912 RepID=UPI003C0EA028